MLFFARLQCFRHVQRRARAIACLKCRSLHACQFSGKTNNFDFFNQNLPKNGLWGRNFKNLSPVSESASWRYYVHQFSDKTNNFEFLDQNLPKNEFLGQNFKTLSLDLELTLPIYHVCQFSVKVNNF